MLDATTAALKNKKNIHQPTHTTPCFSKNRTPPRRRRESDDVDVALDNVSGQAFAEALNEHLRAQGLETRSVGVIQVGCMVSGGVGYYGWWSIPPSIKIKIMHDTSPYLSSRIDADAAPSPTPPRQQANPEQSKHLETARVLVLGQWVDFTNLRTETYTEGSRIPVAAFGTAEEVGAGVGVG